MTDIEKAVEILQHAHNQLDGRPYSEFICTKLREAIALLEPPKQSRSERIARCCDRIGWGIRNGDMESAANFVEQIGVILMERDK